MKFVAVVRHMPSGREYTEEWDAYPCNEDAGCMAGPEYCPDDHERFQWMENNYSCDCNRSIFDPEREADDCAKCGEKEYRLVSLKNGRGELIGSELEDA